MNQWCTRIAFAAISVCICVSVLQAQSLVEEYRFGSFEDAHALSIDGFKNVYISDRGGNMLYKYSLQGKQLSSVGGQGWGNGQFDEPMGIDATLGIAVYAADYNNNRIVRLDKDLHFLGSFSTQDNPNPDANFGYPVDVAVSTIGDIYILDGENSRVMYTSGFATVKASFGDTNAGDGRLVSPKALCTGWQNAVFVLEPGRVVAFDAFGTLLRTFGETQFEDALSIASYGNAIAVLTPTKILLFNQDGSLAATWTQNDILLNGNNSAFRDIAFTKTFVLLLTEQNVIVLPNPINK